MKHYLFALALVAGIAHADGVPLLSPRAATAADGAMLARWQVRGQKATPVTINPHALESNIITVEVEGKTYRFAGSRRPGGVEGIEGWSGKHDSVTTLSLSRDKGEVAGHIIIAERFYEITPGGMLVKLSGEATPGVWAPR